MPPGPTGTYIGKVQKPCDQFSGGIPVIELTNDASLTDGNQVDVWSPNNGRLKLDDYVVSIRGIANCSGNAHVHVSWNSSTPIDDDDNVYKV